MTWEEAPIPESKSGSSLSALLHFFAVGREAALEFARPVEVGTADAQGDDGQGHEIFDQMNMVLAGVLDGKFTPTSNSRH